ncbi:uncharacterized protein Pyn_06789 [Prunus yedoensis var. nudiflora]|uniref:Uncharacterized protein n=1 Tax=Prunus yedoensis var. nudiflora TaxID=2094558 RepID=A0A314YBU9_PRUYE|nr:uncharacterized protein Pyn_06789 [Prunus yedoensis var. nudiflora]
MIWENTGSFTKECQVSEEIQGYSSVKVADVSPKVQSSSASDLKRSDAVSDSRFKNQAKDDGSRFNTKSRNPHVEDAQMLALGGRIIDETNDVDLSSSGPENCQLLHCQGCSLKLDSVGDFMSKLNVKVQVEGGSAIKDVIEPQDFGTKDCNSAVKSCSGVPQLQTEDDKAIARKILQ